MPPALVQD